MKKVRNIIAFLVLCVFAGISLWGQIPDPPEPPDPVLKKGDVLRFIKTYPLMVEDFEKYEVKMNAESGEMTYPEALKANQEFMGILKKHGWDEHFFLKMQAIALGYVVLTAEDDQQEMDPNIEKQIKEIEANTALSEEMKKQMIEQLKNIKGVMKQQYDMLNRSIHKADLELIKPHIEDLKKLFD